MLKRTPQGEARGRRETRHEVQKELDAARVEKRVRQNTKNADRTGFGELVEWLEGEGWVYRVNYGEVG